MSEVYDYWSKEEWIQHVAEIESEYNRLEEKCDGLTNMLEDVVNELDLSDEMIAEHGQHGTPPAELVRLVIEEKDNNIKKLNLQDADHERKYYLAKDELEEWRGRFHERCDVQLDIFRRKGAEEAVEEIASFVESISIECVPIGRAIRERYKGVE